MGNYRGDQPLDLHRGELLAQLGRRMASDDGARYGAYAHAYPDVLLLLSDVGGARLGSVSIRALSASRGLWPREGIPLVLLSADRRGCAGIRGGRLQRMGP